MKHVVCLLTVAALALVCLPYLLELGGKSSQAEAAPPLVLDPSLLEEELPEASAEKQVEVKADNSACYVCHGNYDGEELALIHAKEDIGCIQCHGKSLAHRDDEDNVTPPDVMYALDEIDKACGDCHDTHDAPAKKVIARWRERCPAKTDPGELVCTDCHGQHRLKFRTVWWDKKTRELVVREGDQRIKVREDLTKPEGEEME